LHNYYGEMANVIKVVSRKSQVERLTDKPRSCYLILIFDSFMAFVHKLAIFIKKWGKILFFDFKFQDSTLTFAA